MMTIHKYVLEMVEVQTITVPDAIVYLSVQMQHDRVTVWALVAPSAPAVGHRVEIVGTGKPLPNGGIGKYLGTVQDSRGLVWHVFVPGPIG